MDELIRRPGPKGRGAPEKDRSFNGKGTFMKQRIRKLFSLVLAAALLLGVLPVQAFALAPMSYWENTYVYGPYRIYSEKPLYETTIFGKVIDRDVDFSGNTLYINTGTKIWITMDNHNAYVGSPIVVEHNANLEFDELDIRPEASGKAALTVKSGKTLNLGLTGTSKLNGNAASAVVNND